MLESWETTLDLSDIEDVGILWSAVSNFEVDMRRRAADEPDPHEARDLLETADRALGLLRRIGGPGSVNAGETNSRDEPDGSEPRSPSRD